MVKNRKGKSSEHVLGEFAAFYIVYTLSRSTLTLVNALKA